MLGSVIVDHTGLPSLKISAIIFSIFWIASALCFGTPAKADTIDGMVPHGDSDSASGAPAVAKDTGADSVVAEPIEDAATEPTAESVTKSAPTVDPVSEPEPAPLKSEIPKEKMPAIEVTVTPQKGAIGDLIEWKVEVKKKTIEDRVVLPSSLDFGELEIQSRDIPGSPDDEIASETSMVHTIRVGLLSFETGEFEIPSQKLTVVDGKGNLSEVMTKAFTVKINSLIANEPEPALKPDEQDGEVVLEEDYTLAYIGIGLLVVLLIVGITLLLHKLSTRMRSRVSVPPPPPRPAHIIALEKLNELKSAGYLDEQMHKTFHLKLSEAFREYLGNRYDFDALERSTREIVAELRALSLGVELHREVVQLLEDTDLVKFAKYEPPKEESESLLDEAFRIVDVTQVVSTSSASKKGGSSTGKGSGTSNDKSAAQGAVKDATKDSMDGGVQ